MKPKAIRNKYDETRPITSNSSSSASSSSSSEDDTAQVTLQTVPAAPDGGWGWVVCFASFMCFVILDGMLFTYGVLFVEFLDYFGSGKGETALVGSVFMGMSLFFGPCTSAMVNMWGLRVVSMTGSVIASIAFACSVFAPSLEVLTFTYGFVGGLGVAMVYIPSILVVGFYFDKKRALANGITSSGSGLGAFIFSPLCSYLIERYTWKGAMLLLSGITLNCLVFSSLYLPLKAYQLVATVDVPSEETRNEDNENYDLIDEKSNLSTSNSYMTLNGKIIKLPDIQLSAASILGGDDKSRSTSDVRNKPHKEDLLKLVQTKRHVQLLSSNLEMCPSLGNHQLYNSQNINIVSNPPPPESLKLYNSSANVYLHSYHNISMHATTNTSAISYKQISLRPLDKRDIFYSGSLQRINSSCTLHDDKQKIPEDECENDFDADLDTAEKLNKSDKHYSKVKHFMKQLKRLTGAHLFANPLFWLCILAMSMWTTHSTILTVLPHYSIEHGVSEANAANLLSFIGMSNIVSRILVGWLSSHDKISVMWLNITALFIGGCSCLLMPYIPNYTALVVLAVIFGSCMATWTSLRPIILVEILGLNNLTNAFGLLAMFQGLSFSVGPPIAGILYDVTSSYTLPLLLAGGAFIASAVLFVILLKLTSCLKYVESDNNEEVD